MNEEQVHALARSGFYRGVPLKGRVIETHISWVILTRQFAFKIKKPVKHTFLDFSTLAMRKLYCEKEVTLNRRLSNIYLDVLPIHYKAPVFYLGKERGRLLDYAVQMKKMRAALRMDVLLANKRVHRLHIKALAKKMALFHQQAKVVSTPFDKAQAKADFNDIGQVFNGHAFSGKKKYALLLERAVEVSNRFLDENEAFLQTRVEKGFQRDVHGDLHMANIFLYKDPVIFDCIEFNDTFRQIDLLNELAFFCMDLEAHGQFELSRYFIECYQAHLPCMENAPDKYVFTYYKAYRANVRAKVSVLNAFEANGIAEREREMGKAVRYLHLMNHYCQLLFLR